MTNENKTDDGPSTVDRRGFLRSGLMVGGLGLGYAYGIVHFVRYLVPMGRKVRYREMFAGPVDALAIGKSRILRTPNGETFVMARTGERSFRVLSDVCPHLGCRVHWEPGKNRSLCPCHQGVFDDTGKATSGPPADANQDLTALDTKIRGNSVFVMIKET